VYQLGEDYDPSDQLVASEKAQEWGDRIPIGVIYRVQRPTFEEQIPALKKGPLVNQKLEPAKVERVLAELL
jgi:2-oxoglutarate ferredoxin oxidoreductase subunit beta